MESVPLIPKSKALPNLDVVPIIRELFQDEFELAFRQGTSKRLSQTILTSLQHDKSNAEENESFCKTVNFLQDASSQRRDNLINFSENIYRVRQILIRTRKQFQNKSKPRTVQASTEFTLAFSERLRRASRSTQSESFPIVRNVTAACKTCTRNSLLVLYWPANGKDLPPPTTTTVFARICFSFTTWIFLIK